MISTIKVVPGSVNFTTTLNYSVNNSKGLLKKMIDKKLKPWTDFKKTTTTTKLAQQFFPDPNEKFDRRLVAINKVYMQNLTEILQAQKYSSQLADLGIEITKVNMFQDHSHLNVYWISKNENLNVEETQNILKKTAVEVKKEISSLNYIPKLPNLRFVRDVYLENQIKLEKLLTVMDLGKNYEPSKPQKAFKTSFLFETDGQTFKMRQDVLGLDHDKIKRRILDDIAKFKNIDLPEKEFDFEEVDPKNLIPFDKNMFLKFYKRRQILKKKLENSMQSGKVQNPSTEDEDLGDDYEDLGNMKFDYKDEDYGENKDFHIN